MSVRKAIGRPWKETADGISVLGAPIELIALKQIRRCAETADRAALMADHHKGYAVPIGGVVAYAEKSAPRASATTSPAATRPS